MDIKSQEERSKNMAAIRSKNTKPEIYFRKLLFAQGYIEFFMLFYQGGSGIFRAEFDLTNSKSK